MLLREIVAFVSEKTDPAVPIPSNDIGNLIAGQTNASDVASPSAHSARSAQMKRNKSFVAPDEVPFSGQGTAYAIRIFPSIATAPYPSHEA